MNNLAFAETQHIKEFHANGKLAYTDTIQFLTPMFAHLYPYRSVSPDGKDWIRTGQTKKFHNNGQLAWALSHDENGQVIKDGSPSFRNDGTIIKY